MGISDRVADFAATMMMRNAGIPEPAVQLILRLHREQRDPTDDETLQLAHAFQHAERERREPAR